MMTAEIRLVMPEMAQEILARTPERQRALNRAHVNRLAADMRAGLWRLNGEPIIVAADGTLIDGQHRLRAVVQSRCAIEMLVVIGVDPACFTTIDMGRARSSADLLSMDGVADPKYASGVAINMLRIDRCFQRGHVATDVFAKREILAYVHANAHAVALGVRVAHALHRVCPTPTAVGAAHAWLRRQSHADEDRLYSFFEQVRTGEMISKGDAAFAFRQKFCLGKRSEHSPVEMALLYVRAGRRFLLGKRTERLHLDSDGERFAFPAEFLQ